MEIRGIILFFLYRYIESKQIFKQILMLHSRNFFNEQIKTLEILIRNPIWIFQTQISILPTLDKKKRIVDAIYVLQRLKRTCNFTQKEWLETTGRIEAFLGTLFLDLSW